MADQLLFQFRETDTEFGVTRATLEKLAKELGMNETMTIHLAIRRLASTLLPAYEADDGFPSDECLEQLRIDAAAHMPKGKFLGRKTLR